MCTKHTREHLRREGARADKTIAIGALSCLAYFLLTYWS